MAHIWRKEHKDRSRILDKFYTKQEIVKRCLDEVNKLPYIYDLRDRTVCGGWCFL